MYTGPRDMNAESRLSFPRELRRAEELDNVQNEEGTELQMNSRRKCGGLV